MRRGADVTTAELDEQARASVLTQLGAAHDHFVALERRAWKADHEAEATGAHRVSTWLLRAYAAERDDVPPVRVKGEMPPWSVGP